METNKFMRAFVFSLLMLFVSSLSFANKQEDWFNEAISRGVTESGCYRIVNNGDKKMKILKMYKYIVKKGYVVTVFDHDKKGYMNRIEFTTYDKLYIYMHYALSSTTPNVKPLKEQGKACLMKKVPVYRPLALRGEKPLRYDDDFDELREVHWTGEVENGFIDGSGSGVYGDQKEGYCYFEGTFISGVPASNLTIKRYDSRGTSYYDAVIEDKWLTVEQYESPTPQMIAKNLDKAEGDAKRAFRTRLAFVHSDLPEKYIKEAKLIIKQGKTPVLSQDIIGSLGGIAPTRFYSANQEAAQKRSLLEALSKTNSKAEEALNYMQLLDGMYLSSAATTKKIKEYVASADYFEYWHHANYWQKMEEAQKAVAKLKKLSSTKDIRAKLTKAEQTISRSYKTISTQRAQSKTKRNNAAKKWLGEALEDAIKNSNSPSYRNSDEDYDANVDVEEISWNEFTYEIEDEWRETIGDLIFSEERKTVRYKDNRGKEYKGKIYRDKDGHIFIFDYEYYKTQSDAVIALYAYLRYGRTRKTGRR